MTDNEKRLAEVKWPEKKEIINNPEETIYGWKYEIGYNDAIDACRQAVANAKEIVKRKE